MEVVEIWITPITDRTRDLQPKGRMLYDVLGLAIYTVSGSPIYFGLNSGYLNHNDLNRIEENCKYIAEQLNDYGYLVSITTKTDWTMVDFPYLSQINRIRDNVNILIEAYYKMQGSPNIRYWRSLDWQDVNSLEQNLLNLNTLLELMKECFMYSGTFSSGQEVIL